MEGPERRGAGPESTGINNEQLNLFISYDNGAARDDYDVMADGAMRADDGSLGRLRSHALGHRPDQPHTRDHPGVRGDRLEGVCLRHDQRNY
jgi:hypothetical protein